MREVTRTTTEYLTDDGEQTFHTKEACLLYEGEKAIAKVIRCNTSVYNVRKELLACLKGIDEEENGRYYVCIEPNMIETMTEEKVLNRYDTCVQEWLEGIPTLGQTYCCNSKDGYLYIVRI